MYMPGMVGGVPGVYASLYPGGCTPPWYMPPLYTLGTPATCTSRTTRLRSDSGARRREPWAQIRRNPWVRREVRVNVVNPVKVGGKLCAELLPFSRTELTTIG